MKKIFCFLLLIPMFSFSQDYSLIDFGASTTPTTGNWNNVTSPSVNTAVGLINTAGTATGITLTIDDSFAGINEAGTTTPSVGLPFSATAAGDSFFGSNDTTGSFPNDPTGGFTLSGLDPAKLYSFQIFASQTGVGDNSSALYTVTGLVSQGALTANLDASGNTENSVTISNSKPTAEGTIHFKAEKNLGVNNNTSGFFYLGAIQLTTSPSVGLVYPNGGEQWEVGKVPNITWNSQYISGNVTIEYSTNNGTSWTTIATPSASLGKYAWTIPNSISTQCLVRISSDGLTSQSAAPFSIIANVGTVYRIAVLGSSTAAGSSFPGYPSSPVQAWVWLYRDYLTQHDTRYLVDNLAVSGTNTYNILPIGASVGSTDQVIDTAHNVNQAISNGANGIIVNMPSNDAVEEYPVVDQIANFNLIKNAAGNSIPTRICSVQPRLMSAPSQVIQTAMVTALPATFPDYIDFWTGFANAAGDNILPDYNQGDDIHMNAAAQQILLQRVLANGLHLQVKANVDAGILSSPANNVVDINFTDGNPNAFGANTVGAMVFTPPAATHFNNLIYSVVSASPAILRENTLGANTPFTLTVDSAFAGASGDLGTNNATGAAAIFSDPATYSYWFGQTKTGGENDFGISPTEGFTISNLDNSKYYSFTIFAGRGSVSGGTGTRITQYTVTGATTGIGAINVIANNANVVLIKDIQPVGGTIHIMLESAATSTDTPKYYYINAMRMVESATFDNTSTTWNGSTWSNGVPTTVKAAIFEGHYASPIDATIDVLNMKSLTLNTGDVVINALDNINVRGAVVVNGGTLTIKSNANLYQTGSDANTGNITVERDSNPLFRLDYTLWSTPVATALGQTLSSFSGDTFSTRFHTLNPSNNNYVAVVPSITNFETGKGYLIRMPNGSGMSTAYNAGTEFATFNGKFTGVPNNGTITISGLTADKFNAIGNPYPSTIEADKFILANPGVGPLYFWRKKNDASKTSYASYTIAGGVANIGGDPTNLIVPNGTIQVGQGFIVNPTGTTIIFNNDMRKLKNENQILKTTSIQKNRIWLNLTDNSVSIAAPVSNAVSKHTNQMMVAYMTNATLGVDDAIDGLYYNDYQTALTSLISGDEYIIQGRPVPFDGTDVVPLAFKTTTDGNFIIAIDHVDGLFSGSQDIVLKDNTTGVETDLKAGPYTFAATAGVDNARFSLKYQKTLKVNAYAFNDNSVNLYKNEGTMHIKSSESAIDKVKIYDISGRLIFEKSKVNANETTIESAKFGKQILVVEITSENQIKVSKKLVN